MRSKECFMAKGLWMLHIYFYVRMCGFCNQEAQQLCI